MGEVGLSNSEDKNAESDDHGEDGIHDGTDAKPKRKEHVLSSYLSLFIRPEKISLKCVSTKELNFIINL